MKEIVSILFSNIDLFLINLSVYFFSYNLIELTKSKLNKSIKEENTNVLEYNVTGIYLDDNDNTIDEEMYFFPKDVSKIKEEKNLITIWLYKIGVIVETFGILVTMLKNNDLVITTCLVWLLYIILSLLIIIVINTILKKIFITKHYELNKFLVIQEMMKKSDFKFEYLNKLDNSTLGKEFYYLNSKYAIIVLNNKDFIFLVEKLKELKINIVLYNQEKEYLVIELDEKEKDVLDLLK